MATDHPDAAWVASIIEDLRSWLATPTSSATSQITGGGAVQRAERAISALHGDRPALLVPSATYGMRMALQAVGVRAGDEVLIPALDWPSTFGAVTSLGAVPVAVPVDGRTLTIDPDAAAALRTARTRAAVACHLFAVAADVPALRMALPLVPVVEDAAQAWGSTLDGRPVGTLGDAAVFSAGPGKALDAGEAGAVVVKDWELHDRLLSTIGHPIRQIHGGISDPRLGAFSMRVHPLAAILLDRVISRIDAAELIARSHTMAERVLAATGAAALGADVRRGIASGEAIVTAGQLEAMTPSPHYVARRLEATDMAALINGRSVIRAVHLMRDQPVQARGASALGATRGPSIDPRR